MESMNQRPLLLTTEELAEITGRKLAGRQVEWLTKKHWQFEINARGKPIVARSYAESRLSGIAPSVHANRQRRPNFAAIAEA